MLCRKLAVWSIVASVLLPIHADAVTTNEEHPIVGGCRENCYRSWRRRNESCREFPEGSKSRALCWEESNRKLGECLAKCDKFGKCK
jgi:hypothetical protein